MISTSHTTRWEEPTVSTIVELATNDYVEIWTTNLSGAQNVTATNCYMTIIGTDGAKGSDGTDGVQGETGPTGPSGGPIGPTGATGAAGSSAPEVFYVESTGISQTTSTTYTQKVRLSFTAEAADYLIWWACQFGATNDESGEVQIEEDDTTQIDHCMHRSAYNFSGSSNDNFPKYGGVIKRTLTAGTHTFDMDWRRQTGSALGTIGIKYAVISAMKVV